MIYFYNLQRKSGISYTDAHKLFWSLLMKVKFASSHILLHTYLSSQLSSALQRMSHPCSSLKADWVFSLTMWDRTLNNFPLVAWLGYFQAWLAQILLLFTAPTQTLINKGGHH
jgi:hypothetical protein